MRLNQNDFFESLSFTLWLHDKLFLPFIQLILRAFKSSTSINLTSANNSFAKDF